MVLMFVLMQCAVPLIGDIESMPFVEALRQLQLMVPRSNFCLVHVSMVPTVGPPPGEKKTKPTQHSVKGTHRPLAAAWQHSNATVRCSADVHLLTVHVVRSMHCMLIRAAQLGLGA